MANLPESSIFDAGVYQIETTDPVIGGPSGVTNTPLKNLANRTKYLKDHVDAIEAAYAPKASPAFTGTPTAPTAAAGTNTTQVATTAFVQTEIAADAAPLSHVGATGSAHGVATASVAGFMAAADKSKLDGIAAGAQVNTVSSVAGKTGAVTLAVADVSGAAPLASPALTGTPTAPTPAAGTNSTQVATAAFVQSELTAVLPAGSVVYAARNTAPAGFLKANGAAVSRTTYSALFAAIGLTFGPGDGVNTFNLPDLRGEFIRGWDDGRGVDSGRGFGSGQSSQNLSHAHGVYDPGHAHALNYETPSRLQDIDRGTGNASLFSLDNAVTPSTHHAATGIGIYADGGNESRPRNIALLALIKF